VNHINNIQVKILAENQDIFDFTRSGDITDPVTIEE